MLEILYQNQNFVAINKPNGLLVHRTNIATDATEFALQLLRNQLDKYVYPVHRLDRKTSGVLLFAFDKQTTRYLQAELQSSNSQKIYKAIVRGYFPAKVIVDYPLTNDRGKTQEAITHFESLQEVEIPLPFGKYLTSRYSLIKVEPQTGRMHQIRKHCNHLRHPIIGDRPHGCSKQNRLFKQKWQMNTMLLHAEKLILKEMNLEIKAPLPSEFKRMLSVLGLENKEV